MRSINCSGKELSAVSGVSPSVISRYRNGNRMPTTGSGYLHDLADGLQALASQKKIDKLENEDIYSVLSDTLNGDGTYERFIDNLRYLMSQMKISNIDLARALSFDPSHISRILSGQRKPGDFHLFAESTSKYIARRFIGSLHINQLIAIIGCSKRGSQKEEVLSKRIESWLLTNQTENE